MKHAHQAQFGRPDTACLTGTSDIDKWAALTALTDAAEDYGLGHRTLGVLRALLTFLPTRTIGAAPISAVVFPSNKTISARLNGMPESTLRRHLSQLVKAGIVSRHESANRKRFARNAGQGLQIAFGLDLSPLARAMPDITKAADAAKNRAAALSALRCKLGHLRAQIIAQSGPSTLTDTAALILRRKPDPAALNKMCHDCSTALIAKKTSASDDQNERHIQTESISKKTNTDLGEDPHLHQVTGSFKEYHSYFPTPVRHWQDLCDIAFRLTSMVGIERGVFQSVIKDMGERWASVAVLNILENLGEIANPGAYLRGLARKARAGGLRIDGLLANCQLTT